MENNSSHPKQIQRALWISRLNGWSVAGFAGFCAVVSLLMGSVYGFLVGAAVALSGVMELQGNRLLQKARMRGIGWLVFSQLYLIGVLWAYSINQLTRFDSSNPWEMFSPGFKDLMLSLNPDVYLVEDLIQVTFFATYISLILAVLLYQGGLSIYYLTRKKYLYPVDR